MRQPPSPPSVLGLFPDFAERSVGGVQASGRAAWRAIVLTSPPSAAKLLLYQKTESGRLDEFSDAVIARSRLQAAWAAQRMGREADLALFWHLDLLRLNPLIRSANSRTAVFLHGIECWKRFGWVQRKLLAGVDLFLSNSDHTWNQFLSFNPEFETRPCRTVPLGLGEPDRKAVSPDPPPAVLMLSRLAREEDYKGHRELIAAWPRVRATAPEAQLWIAGDGTLRPELEKLARSTPETHSIRFWGRVSERRKEDLIQKSRCLALPSRGEGFGLVYLEAMRLGRPCLVGDSDAGREVVAPPEAGLAIDPSDPAALADAVLRLIQPGAEWDAWSIRARARYESRFTEAHFQKRLLEALGVTQPSRL